MINLHLETNYNFDINNKDKYYNPNLIRNNGKIKKYQVLHCDFKTSIITCSIVSKNNNQINDETAVVISKKKKTQEFKIINPNINQLKTYI